MTSETTTESAAVAHEIGPDGLVSIQVAAHDIELTGVDGGTVRVRDLNGRSLPDDLTVERAPGSLSIQQRVGRIVGLGLNFSASRRVSRLLVELPAAAGLAVRTASGEIHGVGLRGDQHYRTASGEIRLDDIAGQAELETVSGDLTIRVGGSVDLVARTVSGTVAVEGGRIERLRLSTTSGDISVGGDLAAGTVHAIETITGDAVVRLGGGIRVLARTISGELWSDLPHRADGRIGRRTLVVGDGSAELDFGSVSGDLRVLDAIAAATAAGRPIARPRSEPPPEDATDDPRLEILRALERGELDVAEATTRLAALDGATDG